MITTSRRAVLRAGAIGVVLAPLALPRSAAATIRSAALYRRSRFTPLVQASFELASAGVGWPVQLTQVSDLPYGPAGDSDAFALTFSSPVAGPPQGTYTLRRRRFASTPLFVVPDDAGHLTYQAIINRALT